MTEQPTPRTEAGPFHEPSCNERCTHYIIGDEAVREAFGFPRVPRREPGGINPRQGVVTDSSPTLGAKEAQTKTGRRLDGEIERDGYVTLLDNADIRAIEAEASVEVVSDAIAVGYRNGYAAGAEQARTEALDVADGMLTAQEQGRILGRTEALDEIEELRERLRRCEEAPYA